MIRLMLRLGVRLVVAALVMTGGGFILGHGLPRHIWDQMGYMTLNYHETHPVLTLHDLIHQLKVRLAPGGNTTADRWYTVPGWSADGQQFTALTLDAHWMTSGVVTFRIDHRELRRLIDAKQMYRAPKWSPDGRWIAYSIRQSGSLSRYLLYVIAADGSQRDSRYMTDYTLPSDLWSVEATHAAVTWSGDSRSLILTSAVNGLAENDLRRYDTSLYESPLSDGGLIPLNQDIRNVVAPALSPDGTWIAFVSNQALNWQLYIMKRNGTDVKLLQDLVGESLPVWSRDGEAVGYWVQDEYLKQFYTINLKTGEKRLAYAVAGSMFFPAWRP